MSSLPWLRRQAVDWSLTRADGPADAVARLRFVQADPIRAPAPAQDLILRHRVPGYRVGDLDRAYPTAPLEEEFLHVYGFVARPLRRLLHPRHTRRHPDGDYVPRGLAAEALAFVREHGVTSPRALRERFGTSRVINAWGGQSAATTRALEELHVYGLVRVARREGGVRHYEPAPALPEPLAPAERARGVAMSLARLLAPVPELSLRATLPARLSAAAGGRAAVMASLLTTGELAAAEVDGVRYVWPADLAPVAAEPSERVRLLAPFDPVVWDRRRFEHLWGWPYRFEAYTPPAKRRLGYYALPLLWRDRVIGWANCTRGSAGLAVETGFVDRAPRSRRFRAALDAEVARLVTFLAPRPRRGAVRPPAPRSARRAPTGSGGATPAR